ncbi:MAG: sporulation transcriptional regulator SpoIIID [Clostridia bacterium]|nr:sporulation transcriptional regulator SpoIIID [Clostridia bacterium]
MYDNVNDRCQVLGRYIAETRATVRKAAAHFGIGKSTVHKDVTTELKRQNRALYLRVRSVLDQNKQERHLRGGAATKRKYELTKK